MIYLDNAATTYPKPFSVLETVYRANRKYAYNSGRGGYRESVQTAEKIFAVRDCLGRFFHCPEQNVVFTNNCTTAVNMALKGLLKPGDHVLISALEHNAVFRPIYKLAREGRITYDQVPYHPDPDRFLQNIRALEQPNTAMVAMLHASNVFGVVHPLGLVGDYCRRKGWLFVVDAAQSAGILPIDMQAMHISALCAPGHKSLFGTMGTGVLALADGISPDSLTEGGTGSHSFDPQMPPDLPDRLEAGTLNNPGILSLGAGVRFIEKTGRAEIHEYEMRLTRWLYEELAACPGIKLYTPPEHIGVPVLSFNVDDRTSEETAAYLAARQIAVRGGYHCAPCAHRFFGTDKRGTVRVSPGVFTGMNECEYFLNSVKFRE